MGSLAQLWEKTCMIILCNLISNPTLLKPVSERSQPLPRSGQAVLLGMAVHWTRVLCLMQGSFQGIICSLRDISCCPLTSSVAMLSMVGEGQEEGKWCLPLQGRVTLLTIFEAPTHVSCAKSQEALLKGGSLFKLEQTILASGRFFVSSSFQEPCELVLLLRCLAFQVFSVFPAMMWPLLYLLMLFSVSWVVSGFCFPGFSQP